MKGVFLIKALTSVSHTMWIIPDTPSPMQRETAVDNFRSGKTWVLIATDVIARGMDFKGVNCVINYDFPDSMAAYIHRIGKL